jgi:ABC-type glutathione transport system ATPase component
MWKRTLDCLGVAVAIETTFAELAAPLTSVFRSYAELDRPALLSYRLEQRDWPTLVRDGQPVRRANTAGDLAAVLELDLYTQVAARAKGLVLHAACVSGRDGRAIVLAGVSGAGKSTLTRALLRVGYDYVSEECVALARAGTCIGLARAMHTDEDVDLPEAFRREPYELTIGGGRRQPLLVHPPEARIRREAVDAVAVVVISHAEDASNELVSLSSGQMLQRLWPMMLRQHLDELSAAGEALSRLARRALHTSSTEHALAKVLALCEQERVHAR